VRKLPRLARKRARSWLGLHEEEDA